MPFGTSRLVDEGVVVVGFVRAAVGPAVEDGVLAFEGLALEREPSFALSVREVSASSVEFCERTTKKIAARHTATAREAINAIAKNGDFESTLALVLAS